MKKHEQAKHVLRFDGALTLPGAAAIQTSLRGALRKHKTVEVDCSDAEDVDISFIQLLIAARRTAAAGSRSLALSAPASGALLDALRRSGIVAPSGEPHMPDEAFWLGGSSPAP